MANGFQCAFSFFCFEDCVCVCVLCVYTFVHVRVHACVFLLTSSGSNESSGAVGMSGGPCY